MGCAPSVRIGAAQREGSGRIPPAKGITAPQAASPAGTKPPAGSKPPPSSKPSASSKPPAAKPNPSAGPTAGAGRGTGSTVDGGPSVVTVKLNNLLSPDSGKSDDPSGPESEEDRKRRLFTKNDSARIERRGVCGLPSDELPLAQLLNYSVETLIGHPKAIKFCAISPDELRIATACNRDTFVVLWDLKSHKVMMKLDGHDDGVSCGSFSYDARLLASGSLDNSLTVWDTNTGKVLYKLFGHQFLVSTCSFSRDGLHIVSGSADNSLILWSVKTGLPLGTLEGHTKLVTCGSFSPDGQHILSGSADRNIILWETKGLEKLKQMKAHFDVVLACSYNADGNRIISNDKRTLKVWDASSCTQLFAIPIQPSSLSPHSVPDGPVDGAKGVFDRRFVYSMFSPDGRHILFCSNDRTVTLWDPEAGQEALCLYTRQNTGAMCVGPCNLVAYGDEAGNVYILHLVTPVEKKAVIVVNATPD
jgi:WD40 repeat protein